MRLITIIFTALTVYFLIKGLYVYAGFCLALFVLFLALLKVSKDAKIKKYIKLVEKAKEDFKNGQEFEPFIPVNKAEWQVLETIPGISRAMAKAIHNRVKKQKFNNFVEYANFSGLEIPAYEINKKILKF